LLIQRVFVYDTIFNTCEMSNHLPAEWFCCVIYVRSDIEDRNGLFQ
jgi:hypothetical protein